MGAPSSGPRSPASGHHTTRCRCLQGPWDVRPSRGLTFRGRPRPGSTCAVIVTSQRTPETPRFCETLRRVAGKGGPSKSRARGLLLVRTAQAPFPRSSLSFTLTDRLGGKITPRRRGGRSKCGRGRGISLSRSLSTRGLFLNALSLGRGKRGNLRPITLGLPAAGPQHLPDPALREHTRTGTNHKQ